MWVYFVLLLYWFIMWLAVKSLHITRHNEDLIFTIVAAISLITVMSLRDISVGTDLKTYFVEFQNSHLFWINKTRGHESGYDLLNLVFKNMNISFQGFIGFVSFLFVLPMSMMYYAYSKNVFLSFYLHVTIGLFQMTMSGLRQTIAISITILAVLFLMKDKWIPFIALVLIASYFHSSSLFVLFFLVLYKVKLNRKKAILVYLLTICLSFLLVSVFDISRIISLLIQGTRYGIYLSIFHSTQSSLGVIMESCLIPLFAIVYFPTNSDLKESNIFSLFFLASCVNCSLNILALGIPLIERVGYYFVFYNTMLLSNTLESIYDKKTRDSGYVMLLVAGLIQMLLTFPDSFASIVPYRIMSLK